VQPGDGPIVTLRFERHDPDPRGEFINAYDYRWRELAGAPVDDVGCYARTIMSEVA
jgi:hypothetical protein